MSIYRYQYISLLSMIDKTEFSLAVIASSTPTSKE